MKSSIQTLALLACLSTATPVLDRRQNIDFAAYNAVPILPEIAPPPGDVVASSFTYAASSVARAAASAATVATRVGTGFAAAVTAVSKRKSTVSIAKRNACQPRTPGSGTTVSPDTDTAFQQYAQFSSDAKGAVVPVGYTRIVTNSNSAAQDSTYMSVIMMSSYDTAGCAANCQAQQGCNSFNLFYERDASLEPGPGCEDPSSLTYIKCSLFGGMLTTTAAAANSGKYESSFHIVAAGSNIYVATSPTVPAGFKGGYSFGNATINAPSGYMGVQTFPQNQPYDPAVCAAACNQKSAFDIQQGLPTKANPDICNFFVAYILYKNGQNGVFTCTYYTSAWDSSYATNNGQLDGQGNRYTLGYSNGFAVTNAPVNGKLSTFNLIATGSNLPSNGSYVVKLGTDSMALDVYPYAFSLNPSGQLLTTMSSTKVATVTSPFGNYGINIYFGVNGRTPLTCQLSSANILTCVAGNKVIWEFCGVNPFVAIAPAVEDGCALITMRAVPTSS